MARDLDKEWEDYKETVLKKNDPYVYWLLSRPVLEGLKRREHYLPSSVKDTKQTYSLSSGVPPSFYYDINFLHPLDFNPITEKNTKSDSQDIMNTEGSWPILNKTSKPQNNKPWKIVYPPNYNP